MFPEGETQEFSVVGSGETIVFDRAKHEIVEARSFPGPEYKADLENLMRGNGYTVVMTDDPKLARGLREI